MNSTMRRKSSRLRIEKTTCQPMPAPTGEAHRQTGCARCQSPPPPHLETRANPRARLRSSRPDRNAAPANATPTPRVRLSAKRQSRFRFQQRCSQVSIKHPHRALRNYRQRHILGSIRRAANSGDGPQDGDGWLFTRFVPSPAPRVKLPCFCARVCAPSAPT